jgi:tRNA-dihydrouridine synthase
MLGRAAYENPWMFADVDRRYYGVPNQNLSRKEVLRVSYRIYNLSCTLRTSILSARSPTSVLRTRC